MPSDTPAPFYTRVAQPSSSPDPQGESSPAIPQPFEPPEKPTILPPPSPLLPNQPSPLASAPPAGTEHPARTPHFAENASKDPLINQFTLIYNSAATNAKAGNTAAAKAHYSELLTLYNRIANRNDLHDMNKDIAHFCINDLYETLSKTNDSPLLDFKFGALMGVSLLLVVLGALVITNPSIVGLVTGFSIASSPSPHWIGGEPAVIITGPTTLHAASLFEAADKARLTYLAASSASIEAVVSGEYITLIPKYGSTGTSRITLIAARQDDPTVMAKQAVDVVVA